MARRTWRDEDDLPYYELVCDDCGTSFTCFDDSCYDWRLLRDAAVFAGWLAAPAATGPHRCPGCLTGIRRHDTGTVPLTGAAPESDATRGAAPDRAAETPPDAAALVVRTGPAAGRRYVLDGPRITVGRHLDSDLLLDDVTVSRRHAEFTRHGAGYVVADVGSLNGVYVNRTRVPRAELSDGDEIQIGRFRMTYRAPAVAAVPPDRGDAPAVPG